jgi:hypothetical protein
MAFGIAWRVVEHGELNTVWELVEYLPELVRENGVNRRNLLRSPGATGSGAVAGCLDEGAEPV